jgi:hypothetical protein
MRILMRAIVFISCLILGVAAQGIIEEQPGADSTSVNNTTGADKAAMNDTTRVKSAGINDTTGVTDTVVTDIQEEKTVKKPVIYDTSAFSNKIIFVETPQIGYKWRGGVRISDFLAFDFNYNIGNYVLIDVLFSGIPHLRIQTDSIKGDSIFLNRDNLFIWTAKSRPFGLDMGKFFRYDIGGGVKLYSNSFSLSTYDGINHTVDTM